MASRADDALLTPDSPPSDTHSEQRSSHSRAKSPAAARSTRRTEGKVAKSRSSKRKKSRRNEEKKSRNGDDLTLDIRDARDVTDPHYFAQSIARLTETRAVARWLADNGFDTALQSQLDGFTLSEMLAFSREDWKDLLGTKQGIKIYNKIKHTQSTSHSHYDSNNIRDYYDRERLSAKYGECSVEGCAKGASLVCAETSCAAPLCAWHAYKSLLTSHVYCSHCDSRTWEGHFRLAYQSAAESANSATINMLEATKQLTGIEALTHSAQQHSDSCIIG